MNAKRLLLLFGACAGLANAQGLPDPTRPPAIIEAEPAATPASSGLQSIIRREKGRSAAVINGQYVELGGRVGDATLERIGEDSVVLRSPGGRETMYLTPGVGKQPARGKPEKAKP
jgi:MSHA biogenesis protein MshK